jgi:hypothetical protein
MSVTITDPALLAALTGGPAVTVTDGTGRVVGTFTPEPLVPWDPTLTREELDRRAAEPGGKPLAEFWKQMGRT